MTKLVGRSGFGVGKGDRKERKNGVRGEGPRAKKVIE